MRKYLYKILRVLLDDLNLDLKVYSLEASQKKNEYLQWIGESSVNIVEEFVSIHKLLDSHFIAGMGKTFKTRRFETLLKKWILEYYLKLFAILEDRYSKPGVTPVILEDNPLNHFAVEQYENKFNRKSNIQWRSRPGVFMRLSCVFTHLAVMFVKSLRRGIKIPRKLKKYAVMREAVWSLRSLGGRYFHDDFFVDGSFIKNEDLLLFSRGIPAELGRLKGYEDAQNSPYAHFVLSRLSMSPFIFISRIIPLYFWGCTVALLKELFSEHFSLFSSELLHFYYHAFPYEAVFSHYRVKSELGHSYSACCHIPEAIVAQNYGVRYYLMHWSDNSIKINGYVTAFLACDAFLTWGDIHIQNKKEASICKSIGYVFKAFIKKVQADKINMLQLMGIKTEGRIISFFEETFGAYSEMTEDHFLNFWESALKIAEASPKDMVLMKHKYIGMYEHSKPVQKDKYAGIYRRFTNLKNTHIVDVSKWSFIETIGVSDIVVTQGMTSSSTIALISGIDGLYLDEFGYDHPLSKILKNSVVFSDPELLVKQILNILNGKFSAVKSIPEPVMRGYDAYEDAKGLENMRKMLINGKL